MMMRDAKGRENEGNHQETGENIELMPFPEHLMIFISHCAFS